MKLVHRSAAAALLAPMVLFAVSAWGFVGLRCRITGMVSLAACCPGAVDGASQPPAGPDSVDEPGCCERIVVDNTRPPAAGAAAVWDAGALAVVGVLPVVAFRLPSPWVAPSRSAVDPPERTRLSLRVLHRSLLI